MINSTAQDTTNEILKATSIAGAAAENLGREIKSSARQVGSAIKDVSVAVSNDVGTAAHDTYDSIVASGRDSAKKIEARVQESPLLAIGIALGVGAIASALLFRRH